MTVVVCVCVGSRQSRYLARSSDWTCSEPPDKLQSAGWSRQATSTHFHPDTLRQTWGQQSDVSTIYCFLSSGENLGTDGNFQDAIQDKNVDSYMETMVLHNLESTQNKISTALSCWLSLVSSLVHVLWKYCIIVP